MCLERSLSITLVVLFVVRRESALEAELQVAGQMDNFTSSYDSLDSLTSRWLHSAICSRLRWRSSSSPAGKRSIDVW